MTRLTRLFATPIVLLVAVLVLASFSIAAAQDAPGSPCQTRRLDSGTSVFTLEVDGLEREYRLYVPESYTGTELTPLLLSLHGFAGNAGQQQRETGWDEIADREGFIVAYPQGTGSPARWNAGQTEIAGLEREPRSLIGMLLGDYFETVRVDDVAFIRSLIGELQAMNCIDPARVYVNGMSNGGGMTNRLACQLSDVIAAAGMVAGAYTDFPGGCHPSRPMPIIAFHGVVDPIVPYEGDVRVHFPAVEDWVADWAARNHCDPTPETVEGTVGAVTGWRYVNCTDDAEVVFYSIADGGHTWPGGSMGAAFLIGKTSHDIDASETMWAFYEAHSLP